MGFIRRLLKGRRAPEPPAAPSVEAEAIMVRLDCPCRWICTDGLNPEDVTELYKTHLAEGQEGGFIPLMVLPSPLLAEMLEMQAERESNMGLTPAESRRRMIDAAARIDTAALIRRRYEAALPPEPDFSDNSLMGAMADGNPLHSFVSVRDIAAQRLVPELILADIPTRQPAHLPAWLPMGSYLSGPSPEEQIALFAHWQEHFGCLPAVVSCDSWECYVTRPPISTAVALGLAKEQMAFCPELVYQGMGTLGALAHSLLDAPVWCFWWG
jgi:hypothetical protein